MRAAAATCLPMAAALAAVRQRLHLAFPLHSAFTLQSMASSTCCWPTAPLRGAATHEYGRQPAAIGIACVVCPQTQRSTVECALVPTLWEITVAFCAKPWRAIVILVHACVACTEIGLVRMLQSAAEGPRIYAVLAQFQNISASRGHSVQSKCSHQIQSLETQGAAE